MSFKKETLLKLSTIAHVVIAVCLSNLTTSIIRQLLILISIGVIGGIQCICIRKIDGEQRRTGDDSREP